MKKHRAKTKIICTLGPSSSEESVIREMMMAGMDVCRINFSHGSHRQHAGYADTIRKLNIKYRRKVRLLADLEGARMRIGLLPGHKPLPLKKNQSLYLSCGPDFQENTVHFDYHGNLSDIEPARFIYIDDGNITLEITGIEKSRIRTRVLSGSLLKERKGINIPGAKLNFPLLNEKDMKDIDFAVSEGFDYIAQSFVTRKENISALKGYARAGKNLKIAAKIESQEGIDNIDEIMSVSDMIMIARGDLGISIPVYRVPFVQKELISRCREAGKKSITATQMLESMTENPFPTRAEVSDVANAVVDGSDYVMLSAETSVGRYPVDCVRMMNEIIKYSEIYTAIPGHRNRHIQVLK